MPLYPVSPPSLQFETPFILRLQQPATDAYYPRQYMQVCGVQLCVLIVVQTTRPVSQHLRKYLARLPDTVSNLSRTSGFRLPRFYDAVTSSTPFNVLISFRRAYRVRSVLVLGHVRLRSVRSNLEPINSSSSFPSSSSSRPRPRPPSVVAISSELYDPEFLRSHPGAL